jgi:fatty-acyl-CoA synthase
MAAQGNENKRAALRAWTRALERTAPIARAPHRTLPVVVQELAQRLGDAPALSSPAQTLSYRALAEQAQRFSRWAIDHGLVSGAGVALLMENCPQYLAIWLGLTRVGATVALINTNLTGELLAHSINAVRPRYVICSAAFAPRVSDIRRQLEPGTQCWLNGAECTGFACLDTALSLPGGELDPASYTAPSLGDRALYIYTSGTTGLPKAAIVTHHRLMQWSHWFAGLMDVTSADRMFNCLPLYHSVGGVVATGATLVGGGTVVLRERFSASAFWTDVVQERCTLFQYIGELCRYLLTSVPQPEEAQHRLRLACGNGLRADVWGPFQERFRIPQILEYYASTEGNFSLYNCEGRVGSIGRMPAFLGHRLPVALVSFDVEAGLPRRDAAGHCVRCQPGEVGEAIGEIATSSAASQFEGYTDSTASERKVLRDVFSSGDAWYRTGDLMRQDSEGFYYFVDRVGDTFRWKGENVSTTEVAGVIEGCSGVADVAIYGVTVPHTEGRAGMAALVVNQEFSLERLQQELTAKLPPYARPMFIRLLGALELTGTFKLRKQDLAREGYDPGKVRDLLFVYDQNRQRYVVLDDNGYENLQRGGLRGGVSGRPTSTRDQSG